MSHRPEQLAATYLAGMQPRARRSFEAHLLDCEPCWREVSLARRGRELAESVRALAPGGIREDIRAAVAAASAEPHAMPLRRRRIAVLAAGTLAALVTAGTGAGWHAWHHPHRPAANGAAPPSALAAAVVSFRDDRLPGTAVPADAPPDLSPLGLHLVAAGAGSVADASVSMYAYRTAAGTKLVIYRSARPIPEAAEAHELGGPEAAWSVQSSGVTIICARGSHTLLLSSDVELVRQVGALLHVI